MKVLARRRARLEAQQQAQPPSQNPDRGAETGSESESAEARPTFPDRAASVLLSAPGLVRREGQLRMLRLLARVLAGERPERHAAVEAGCGVGKSFGYLVPVMLWCAETGGRAVVATATRGLQEQLAGKDAPFVADLVRRATGRDVKVAVLYGKGNYLCPALLVHRLEELWARANALLSVGGVPDQREQEELCWLDMLARWLEAGGTGVKDHLPSWPFLPGAQEDRDQWWSRVSAADEDADCAECRFRGACGFRAARDAAAAADVVVANHHLVVADALLRQEAGLSLFSGKGAKPAAVLVLDEAHEFLKAAREGREVVFSQRRVARLRSDAVSFLRDLHEWTLRAEQWQAGLYVREKLDAAREWAGRRYAGLGQLLDALFSWALKHLGENDRRPLLPGHSPPAAGVLEGLEEFFSPAAGLLDFAVRAAEAVESAVEGDRDLKREFAPLKRRAGRLVERWRELEEAFRRAVLMENHYRLAGWEGDVCYTEQPGRFGAHPADPAPFLRSLWRQYEHVFLTSATLFPFPQSEGFRWFCERFGFGEGEIVQAVVPSPFRYEEQMRAVVLVNSELAPPGNDGGDGEESCEQYARRVDALARAVLRTLEKVDGGVLALFTSYKEMRDVAVLVRGKLPAGRLLVVQGEAGRAELLERFKVHGRAVLFGVSSFWQGVDVPGDALSAVLIARLPFPQPDDPDVEAECWLAGRGWWAKVCRPLAALALRQGVGRLIRTETDTGLVVICDPRAAARHRRFAEACLPVRPKVAKLA